jgi:hypothetical protein
MISHGWLQLALLGAMALMLLIRAERAKRKALAADGKPRAAGPTPNAQIRRDGDSGREKTA